jgi:hypothetical protein
LTPSHRTQSPEFAHLWRRLQRAFDSVKHGRMQRTKPLGNFVVTTIHRERVLDQIVRSQLKKSTSLAIFSAVNTAEGISIIAPI